MPVQTVCYACFLFVDLQATSVETHLASKEINVMPDSNSATTSGHCTQFAKHQIVHLCPVLSFGISRRQLDSPTSSKKKKMEQISLPIVSLFLWWFFIQFDWFGYISLLSVSCSPVHCFFFTLCWIPSSMNSIRLYSQSIESNPWSKSIQVTYSTQAEYDTSSSFYSKLRQYINIDAACNNSKLMLLFFKHLKNVHNLCCNLALQIGLQ